MIRVTHEFNGMGDYWGGNGRRNDKDAGCLFAFYGANTSLACIVDQLCDDYYMGGDCDDFPDDVSNKMIREAIMTTMLNEAGRADVDRGAIAECSATYTSVNGYDTCRDCGAELDDEHEEDCDIVARLVEQGKWEEGEPCSVTDKDCERDDDDVCMESPIFVALVEIDVCPNCGCYVEDDRANDDGLCDACAYWELCHNDSDRPKDPDKWVWVNKDGGEVGPFDTDSEALDNRPESKGCDGI